MIALRRKIERGVRHPVLGPLCLILLALLLAFTVMHATHDQIHEGELVVCVAFLISVIVSLLLPRPPTAVRPVLAASRAPPQPPRVAHQALRIAAQVAIPLRL